MLILIFLSASGSVGCRSTGIAAFILGTMKPDSYVDEFFV